MNVLIVYAHHEPSSFTAAMKNVAIEVLSRQGHSVNVSDLYGEGFNALAQKWDFVTTSGGHFNYMLEQKHAASLDLAFSPDIGGEIQKVRAADFILFVAPVWWFSVPAILKGWFDRVLAMGVAWDGGRIYERGLLRGKQAMLIVSAGGPVEYYQINGRHKATPLQILHPINHGTLAFCGLNVHEPFIALGVLGMSDDERTKTLGDLQFRLQHFIDSPQWLTYYH
ncbi:MAG TPA: NAD(P)H-dependent oxidoreductase [Candidatus Saccharimonadales bacterium]|nr:NAD(P)H-dependent oxidoreductase [Candidatus Saccharimonadales bacterium]